MSLTIIDTPNDWRDALTGLRHDWYHTWDAHQLAQDAGEGEPVLLLYASQQATLALPLLIRELDNGEKDGTSVYGYSGLIASSTATQESVSKFMECAHAWLLEHKIIAVFSRSLA